MLRFILFIIISVVVVEATVEIVVKSLLFEGFRERIGKLPLLGKFIEKLVSCGHCFSVWVSLSIVPVVFIFLFGHKIILPFSIVWWIILSLLVHRLSNYLHMFIDNYIDKFYRNYKK